MNIPTLNPIQSSSISQIGYADNEMYVRFVPSKGMTEGKLYRYVNVPEHIYASVIERINAGGSAGKIINELVVRGGFSYEVVPNVVDKAE